MTCSRRLFLLGTATTFAGAFLAACGQEPTDDVAKTAVPVGGSVILDKFIIAQPTAGNYVAYSSTCPHEFKKITVAQGDTVRCTAHGSTFTIADGSVVSGPAVRGLREVALEDQGERLVASDPQS
ncbi:Rieske (2Fe-2S) protein [Corynebacterium sanguinis]|uniref:Rieske (2Fe-2S) protein n=1 Tax=Corynebacterium sanguinis TaxID=2594913 RepID=UPI0011AA14E4|nr:Rieske (2Fe-2S) protein [Corynebacterium sanguinis]MCT1493342.1 Rieske (2Fe-2S) protein [Corynebacterium sanguinis]MCT2248498.1 Rieske (2Fe-2S) protein [Corynebacterium sanguinis]MDN8577059.1 Rieske (2Fe-2S) protein [Corynebacterium sanguinis]